MSSGTLKTQLIKSFTSLMFLQILGRAIGMITSVIVARGLGVHGYGVYAYATALVALPQLLSELNAGGMIRRSTVRSQVLAQWSYLRSMVIRFSQLSTLLSCVVVLVSWVVLWMVSERVSTHQTYTVTWLLLNIPVSILNGIVGSLLYGLNHVVAHVIAGSIIPSVVHLAMIGLLFELVPGTKFPEYVAFVNVMSSIVALGLLCVVLWRRLPEDFYRGETVYHTREWLREALPFILTSVVVYIDSKVDIFMLGFFQPVEQVGLYSMGFNASVVVMTVSSISNAVLAPHIARLYVQRDIRTLQRLLTTSTRLNFLGALGVALVFFSIGEELIVWMVGPQFAGAYTPLVILTCARLIAAASGPVILVAHMTHHEKDSARVSWISAVLNPILNAVLIPHYGIAGAATATGISLVFRNIWLWYVLKRHINLRCGIV